MPNDKTLRELQSSLPWTSHYHKDFRSNPQTHKDFAHALLHIHKAGGKLATVIDEAEHGGFDWTDPDKREAVGNYIADMVICALRMATTCPDGQLDLQEAVTRRLAAKNNQRVDNAGVQAADAAGNRFYINGQAVCLPWLSSYISRKQIVELVWPDPRTRPAGYTVTYSRKGPTKPTVWAWEDCHNIDQIALSEGMQITCTRKDV